MVVEIGHPMAADSTDTIDTSDGNVSTLPADLYIKTLLLNP